MGTAFNPYVMLGTTIGAFGFSKIIKNPKAAQFTGTMLEAMLVTDAATLGLKLATRRGRPDGNGNDSFPSAHTSTLFAMASVTQKFYGFKAGIPAYALASVVGISRLDANRHAASDVLAGALLGGLLGWGTAQFHQKEFSKNMILPVSNNHPGISLIHQF
ncbi:phosphatase PAP2 family protein [bacterium]|nr:phosphatase PAP2 family protein [bacterium]